MTKTQRIDLLTTIRRSRISFLSIIIFVALGLAFHGGTTWASEFFSNSVNRTYDDCRYQVLQISSPFALSEEQIADLNTIDGVDAAEGFNIVYRFLEQDGKSYQAAICQLTDQLNLPINVQGTLPAARDEIAVTTAWAKENGVSLGDTVKLREEFGSDNRSIQPILAVSKWEQYDEISSLTQEDPGYLATNTFRVTALMDAPSDLCTNDYSHGACPGNGLEITAVMFVSKEAMRPEAFGGYHCIAIYNEELSATDRFDEVYMDAAEKLSASVLAVVEKWNQVILDDYRKNYGLLKQALEKYKAAADTLPADAKQTYEEAAALSSMLQENEELVENLAPSSFTIRSNNAFIVAYNLRKVIQNTKTVLSIVFLIVGVLISYSTVSRLVGDSIRLIGTKKALGFQRSEISRLFMFYVVLAVLLGILFGGMLGVYGIEKLLSTALLGNFTMHRTAMVFHPKDLFIPAGIELLLSLLAAAAACRRTMKRKVISLLTGTENANIPSIIRKTRNRKTSVLNEAIRFNLLNDRKRVAGMLLGITATTVLLTTGTTFYLNFSQGFETQFESFYQYDYKVRFEEGNEDAAMAIRQVLEKFSMPCAEVNEKMDILYLPNGASAAPNVMVPMDLDAFGKLVVLKKTGNQNQVYNGGVWVGEFYHFAFSPPEGAALSVQTFAGKRAKLVIDGYCPNYTTVPLIILDTDTYYETFRETLHSNEFLIRTEGGDVSSMKEELEAINGVIMVYNFYTASSEEFAPFRAIVGVLSFIFILMASLMALMMVTSLMAVYVIEKKRELITLVINGYSPKSAKSYIYKDTAVLAFIGIVIGIVLGSISGDMAISALDVDTIHMMHGVNPVACAISAAATALLMALISHLSLRLVDRFRLSDINT